MLIPKKNRLAVYSYLFKEGLIVTKKDLTVSHAEIGVPNLQVVKLCLSLKTRGYVKENFVWAHHYFYLTDEGIAYLREYLHLPAEIIPATLKKLTQAPRPGAEGAKEGAAAGGDKPQSSRFGGSREGYRREGAKAF